jgi:D-alanyl-D-alanine carboxypeptidase (penicillin-binding protein 5/6)
MSAYVFRRVARQAFSHRPRRGRSAPALRLAHVLQPGMPVVVVELVHGVVVQSGNDASIARGAMAGRRRICGLMNRGGAPGHEELRFRMPPGSRPQHYSTARPVSPAGALIRDFLGYARYYAGKYRYNNITQINRNRLCARPERGR